MRTLVICLYIITALLSACSRGEKTDNLGQHDHAKAEEVKYTCSMHPQVIQDQPGVCPICGMTLVKVNTSNDSANSLMLNDSQMKLANITTRKVSVRPLGQTLIVNARLVEDEDLAEVISSRADGRIEKLFVKETGRMVQAGEPLYELYSETLLSLQREYLLAKEQYESFGKDESHYKSFLRAAEQKLLLYGLSKKQVDALAQSKSIQSRVTLLSPSSGIISRISVTEGQYVNEGTLLYRIEDIRRLWLEAELYPNEVDLVKFGDKLNARVNGFESLPVEGKVIFMSPEYRGNSQVSVIRAEIENPGLKFKPGMEAQVFFTHSIRDAIAVPTDAVIREGRGSHVYVETGLNTFQPRMVKTGLEDFEQIEITDGLKEGDRIAVTGAYLLYSEIILKKGSDPMAGHHH
ncbi:MAG TPA: efflux RND transporter periplasmic adaptor subunit [Cyclobacteriaceae bacterium]|nr:efflux RND transporter periplasmic adaptor subunit [Cyclobacteriaceae bacterium]